MNQFLFDTLPTSDRLASLIRERRALPVNTLARRLDLATAIASVAYREIQPTMVIGAIEDAKETSFGLIAVRPVQPINALVSWGVAAVARNDALAWRLARLPRTAFAATRSKAPPVDLGKALRTQRYAQMLVEAHCMLAAVAGRYDGSSHERTLLSALHSDPHQKRTYAWIETLHALIVAVRDRRDLNAPITERAERLTRLYARAPLEQREALDFPALGVLGVARQLGLRWTATAPLIPHQLLWEAPTQPRQPLPSISKPRSLPPIISR